MIIGTFRKHKHNRTLRKHVLSPKRSFSSRYKNRSAAILWKYAGAAGPRHTTQTISFFQSCPLTKEDKKLSYRWQTARRSCTYAIAWLSSQWRRSDVKSEGVRVSQVKPSNPKPIDMRFRFRCRKWAIWSFSAFFLFRPKMNLHFRFIFRFRSKNPICVGTKMSCSQLNRN